MRVNGVEKQVRPSYSEFDISATLSSSPNYYNLNLTWIPTKIELTYTSNHASSWSDQSLGLYANNVWYRFNCWDGQNFNYNRCWIQIFQNWAEVNIVQDKYQSTWTWQTVLTFEVNSCSVQQWNAAAVIWTPNASQQTAISWLFVDYSNLSLRAYGNKSTLTSDVHVKVRY